MNNNSDASNFENELSDGATKSSTNVSENTTEIGNVLSTKDTNVSNDPEVSIKTTIVNDDILLLLNRLRFPKLVSLTATTQPVLPGAAEMVILSTMEKLYPLLSNLQTKDSVDNCQLFISKGGIDVIVSLLQEFHTNDKLLGEALLLLTSIASSVQQFLTSPLCTTIFVNMLKHRDNEDLYNRMLLFLEQVCQKNNTLNETFLTDNGIVDFILASLSRYAQNPMIRSTCYRMLFVVRNNDNVSTIMDKNLVTIVMNDMHMHIDDIRIVISGCEVLLCTVCFSPVKETFINGDHQNETIINFVLRLMTTYTTDTIVQMHCLVLLTQFCRENLVNLRTLNDNNGVNIIHGTLLKHVSTLPSVRQMDCYGLLNLLGQNFTTNLPLLLNENIMETILYGLKHRAIHDEHRLTVDRLLLTLWRFEPETMNTFVTNGGMDVLLLSLRDNMLVPCTTYNLMSIIYHLCSEGDQTLVTRWNKTDIVKLILQGMRNNSNPDEKFGILNQSKGCEILALLCKTGTFNKTEFVEQDGIATILYAMKTCLGNDRIQVNGSILLQIVCKFSHEYQTVFVAKGGIDTIAQTMRCYPHNISINHTGTLILNELSVNKDTKNHVLVNENARNVITSAILLKKTAISAVALETKANLLQDENALGKQNRTYLAIASKHTKMDTAPVQVVSIR